MKALTKIILLGEIDNDGHKRTWPVASFGDVTRAKAYATFCTLAMRSHDLASLTALDKKGAEEVTREAGASIRYFGVKAPYDPEPDLSTGDDLDMGDDSPASENGSSGQGDAPADTDTVASGETTGDGSAAPQTAGRGGRAKATASAK